MGTDESGFILGDDSEEHQVNLAVDSLGSDVEVPYSAVEYSVTR